MSSYPFYFDIMLLWSCCLIFDRISTIPFFFFSCSLSLESVLPYPVGVWILLVVSLFLFLVWSYYRRKPRLRVSSSFPFLFTVVKGERKFRVVEFGILWLKQESQLGSTVPLPTVFYSGLSKWGVGIIDERRRISVE